MDGGDNADMTVNNRSEEKNTQDKSMLVNNSDEKSGIKIEKRALLIITVIFVIVLVAVITAFYTLNKNHQNQNKNFTFANMEDCMQFYMNRNFGEQEASDKCHELEILDKGRDNMDSGNYHQQESYQRPTTYERPSPKMMNIGINIDKYNPSTGMAGDIKFVKFDTKAGGLDAIFNEYGRPAPENNGMGAGRLNPQPTFVVAPGTKIHSLISGVVFDVPYIEHSKDYSVMVQADSSDGNAVTFETEHIKGVTVKKGDKVTAGQVLGVASDYDAPNLNGMSLIELGVLIPGNPPKHACTFDYLDDSVKQDIFAKLRQLESDWEAFMGDTSIFNEAQQSSTPGCLTNKFIYDNAPYVRDN